MSTKVADEDSVVGDAVKTADRVDRTCHNDIRAERAATETAVTKPVVEAKAAAVEAIATETSAACPTEVAAAIATEASTAVSTETAATIAAEIAAAITTEIAAAITTEVPAIAAAEIRTASAVELDFRYARTCK